MIRLGMILILMLAVSPALAMSNRPNTQVIVTGRPAPEFTLETVSGKSLTLTQARQGKKTVLFFWATWCPHCHEELERVRQDLAQIQSKGVTVLLVNVGETKEDAAAFLKHQQIPLDSFVDEDNTVSGQYGVVGIPSLFFIDEKGVIHRVEHEFPSDYINAFNQ